MTETQKLLFALIQKMKKRPLKAKYLMIYIHNLTDPFMWKSKKIVYEGVFCLLAYTRTK